MGLQLLCLLVAVMFFNSYRYSWTHVRIAVAQTARGLLDCSCPHDIAGVLSGNATMTAPATSTTTTTSNTTTTMTLQTPVTSSGSAGGALAPAPASKPCLLLPLPAIESERVAPLWVKHCRTHAGLSLLSQERLHGAALWTLQRGYDRAGVDKYLEEIEKFRVEHVTSIPLPLVNVRFDVNGLGILAGLGFPIFLGWLALSLRRESENMICIRASGNASHLLTLLRADQLFAPTKAEAERSKIADFATYLPLLLLGIVAVHDVHTADVGANVDRWLTALTYAGEGTLLWFNLFLTCWCLREHTWLGKLWQSRGDESELKREDVWSVGGAKGLFIFVVGVELILVVGVNKVLGSAWMLVGAALLVLGGGIAAGLQLKKELEPPQKEGRASARDAGSGPERADNEERSESNGQATAPLEAKDKAAEESKPRQP